MITFADFFSFSQRTFIQDIDNEKILKKIFICGWIATIRDHGNLVFVDIRDGTGKIQSVIDSKKITMNDNQSNIASLKTESAIGIIGTVTKRSEATINKEILHGTIEIQVEKYHIFNSAKTLPFNLQCTTPIDEELRIKYRYIDLRNQEMGNRIRKRHLALHMIRTMLHEEGFYEIETPILTKNTPEGAREFVVPSRLKPGSVFSLPQSPQLYKQLLMCGGLERYFQIARCFRDEDLRADRQFEFTQLDIEFSFVDLNMIKKIIEKILQKLFLHFLGNNISLPIQSMTYKNAFINYGSDKPDLRFEYLIHDVTEIFSKIHLSFLENAFKKNDVKAGAILIKDSMFSRSDLEEIVNTTIKNGAPGLLWLRKNADGSFDAPIAKYITAEIIQEIEKKFGKIEEGGLLFVMVGGFKQTWEHLGALRVRIGKKLTDLSDKYVFTWITDFPLLEYDEETKKWTSVHHPFTRPCNEWENIKFEEITAQSYDIVLNGIELGGGSMRIYEKELQEKIFSMLGLDKKTMDQKFGFLLEAQEYGFPQHGGIALGIDRLLMILFGADTIRDVIAFPKLSSGDPLMDSPSQIDEVFLHPYGLSKREKIK